MNSFLILLLLSPLLGAALNGLVFRSKSVRVAGILATSASLISFLSAIVLAVSGPSTVSIPWIQVGDFAVDWSLKIDPLTTLFILFVTGIAFLIHLFSMGYMEEEPSPYRYFAYLNLFLFNMLLLVTAGNLAVLFVGWEGVGLCSYLLIGYWFKDRAKANAGMKAFVMNRIGDAGFLIGLFIFWGLFHSLEFSAAREQLFNSSQFDLRSLSWLAFFLFVGAMGKSAQIPLFVWLPDAMAGPTPVSALIHAATMVTAGIYLIARLSFIYQLVPTVGLFISVIGISTALMAALIATSQSDIKKVLAYSTVSQLGLMFLGLGQGAYFAAIFHVFTHAFFKALLFLGAGSVIHGMHGEQEIEKMGGLKKYLPGTHLTFLIGTLAIAGIPPLAGFFSKDALLYEAQKGNYGLLFWGLGLAVSSLTAYYMFRLYTVVFLGQFRGPETIHPHESKWPMLLPLCVLAVGSVGAGFLGMPEAFHVPNFLEHFLSPVLANPLREIHPAVGEWPAMGIATLCAVLFSATGVWVHSSAQRRISLGKTFKPLAMIFTYKFWIDEFYGLVIVRPFNFLCRICATLIDRYVIEGLVHTPLYLIKGVSGLLGTVQSGMIQFYILVFAWSLFGWLWYSLARLM